MKEKRLKVLFIAGSYPPALCGIGDYTALLVRELSARISAHVLTSSFYNTKEDKSRIKVYPVVGAWKIKNLKKIMGTVSGIRPDIVHIQYPSAAYKKNLLFNFLPLIIKISNPRVKVISTFHEPVHRLGITGQLRMIPNMLFSDGCIFIEEEGYKKLPLLNKAAAAAKKRAFIPAGSNIPKAAYDPEYRRKIMKRAGIGPKKKLLITFGFINRIKNYETLFNAYDKSQFSWIHIGSIDPNNVYQAGFLRSALKAGEKIFFTGYLSAKETAKLLACADVSVFPFSDGVTDRHATFMAALNQPAYIAASHADKRGYDKSSNVYY
ncbi:MAG TPA: hypothetical protein ENN43_07780, partial [bacterium]|nr:hypothetical protein [bacterium]